MMNLKSTVRHEAGVVINTIGLISNSLNAFYAYKSNKKGSYIASLLFAGISGMCLHYEKEMLKNEYKEHYKILYSEED